MKKLKGILIDVENRCVREVVVDGSLKDYYKLLNCDCITCVSYNDDHDVIVDDEGLLKNPTKFFSLDNVEEIQYAGNGLLIKVDIKTGAWISHKLDIEEIKKEVRFFEIIKVRDAIIAINMFNNNNLS